MQDSIEHVGPLSSWPVHVTFLPHEKNEKETEHKGINLKLISKAKCF
jgi:hypothetical protein